MWVVSARPDESNKISSYHSVKKTCTEMSAAKRMKRIKRTLS